MPESRTASFIYENDFLLKTRFFNYLYKDPFFKFGSVSPSIFTLFAAFQSVLKFFILVLMSVIVTQTTKISKLILGLEKMFQYLPLKPLNVSPTDLSIMVFLSIGFIPLFSSLTNQVLITTQSRGLDLNKNPVKFIKILSVNLINSIFKFTYDISNSMESRGYTGIGKTSLYELHIDKKDIAFLFFILLFSFILYFI